ncbi:MAG: GNAT family N-acetyltransferase [Gammaproteobacteria bacterium]
MRDSAAITLIEPSADFARSYRAYIAELGDEVRYPFPLDFDHSDFARLLHRLREFRDGIALPDGFVPSATYWLVCGNELLGVSNLRLELNERLRKHGGHIGLGIRPSERGRGLGKLLLRLTLAKARERGIAQVHIHCHQHNRASARMIMANGGVLDSEVLHDGQCVQRYIIDQASL